MTRKEIHNTFEVSTYATGDKMMYTILSKGKFQGEPDYAVHFYEVSCEGDGEDLQHMEDGLGDYVTLISVTDDDRTEFPSIAEDTTNILLTESDNGFVSVRELDDNQTSQVYKDYEDYNAALEQESLEQEDDEV